MRRIHSYTLSKTVLKSIYNYWKTNKYSRLNNLTWQNDAFLIGLQQIEHFEVFHVRQRYRYYFIFYLLLLLLPARIWMFYQIAGNILDSSHTYTHIHAHTHTHTHIHTYALSHTQKTYTPQTHAPNFILLQTWVPCIHG